MLQKMHLPDHEVLYQFFGTWDLCGCIKSTAELPGDKNNGM